MKASGNTQPGHAAAFNCLRPYLPTAGRPCRVAGHCKWGPSRTSPTPRSFSKLPGCAVLQLLAPFIILRSSASFYRLLVSFHSYGNQDPNNSQEQVWSALFCVPDEFSGSRNSCFCTQGKDSTCPRLRELLHSRADHSVHRGSANPNGTFAKTRKKCGGVV